MLKLKSKNAKSKLKIILTLFLFFSHTFSFLFFPFYFTTTFAQDASSSATPVLENPSQTPTPFPTPASVNQDTQQQNEQISASSAQQDFAISDNLDNLSGQLIFDSPGSRVDSSARIKLPTKIKKLSKVNFIADEGVTIVVENTTTQDTNFSLLNRNASEIPIQTEVVHDVDPTVIKILPPPQLRPGRYSLKITDPEGNVSTQAFTWGVLAINTNKSIYLPQETAKLSLAVLDETGMMVCDAKVDLQIYDPSGNQTRLTTDSGEIKVNPECKIHDYTTRPDYEAEYLTVNPGKYSLTLSATTQQGPFSIDDSFEVRAEVPFDIERQSATRIYPPKTYPVKISILANDDFRGAIREIVPSDFVITPLDGAVPFKETKIVESNRAKSGILDSGISLAGPFSGEYPMTNDFGEEVEDPLLRTLYQAAGLKGHDGVDYAIPEGTTIYAVDGGKVYFTGDRPYGNTVMIEHGWGKSYYGHLSEFLVQPNQIISAGDKIGLSGSTGLSTGPHLHFGIKLNDNNQNNGYYGKINPLPYLNASSFVTNQETVQIITWEVDIKKGEKIDIGYNFKAPQISPQLYFLGPLQFRGSTINNQQLAVDATSSAILNNETMEQWNNESIIFSESRRWQLAADAISFTDDDTPDINSTTDATSFTSTSWTPPSSGLIILFVFSRGGAGNNVPTVTGNSITWTQIANYKVGTFRAITLFGANASGSSSGSITLDYAGNTQTTQAVSVFYATGVDLSGGVAAAFVQTQTNTGTCSGTDCATVTLNAAGNSNNRPIAAFAHDVNEATAPRTNWTEADDLALGTPARAFETQYRGDAFETTASSTITTSSVWMGMAAEIKFDSGGAASPTLEQLMRHGKWFNSSVHQAFTY